jgi:hypothetical protein
MNSVVRTPDRRAVAGWDAVQAFLELEAAADKLTNVDANGARAILDTGAPATILAELGVPATKRNVMIALGSLMAAFPSASAKPDLDAYAAVLIDNLPESLSNLVLRLAVKHLIRHQRFLPAVSEILGAIEAAEKRVRRVPERLAEIVNYVPMNPVWVSKYDEPELWKALCSLYGREPVDFGAGGRWFREYEINEAQARGMLETSCGKGD